MSRIYGTGLWQRTRLAVLERDGYRCHWCGGRATQADHLKPLARGGAAFNPDNLVASCLRCNARRGAQTSRFLTGGPTSTPAVGNGSLTDPIEAERVRFGAIRG